MVNLDLRFVIVNGEEQFLFRDLQESVDTRRSRIQELTQSLQQGNEREITDPIQIQEAQELIILLSEVDNI